MPPISAAFPAGQDKPRGNCAAPEHLPLVDAAFERPGGEAGDLMRETLCKGCPAGHQCLAWAMAHREYGMWGGTSANGRTRHGGPPKVKAAS